MAMTDQIISFPASLLSVNSTIAALCIVLTLRALAYSNWLRFRNVPLPPGPSKTSWLLGHLSILPETHQWETYTEWAKKYGPVIYFRAVHQHVVVLSSFEDCEELLDKRSMLYASRPHVPMTELLGFGFAAALMPYGEKWRTQRRLFQQLFKKNASLGYRPEQMRKVNDMLISLLEDPDAFRTHLRAVSSAMVLSITYGYDIQTKEDPFVHLADLAADVIGNAFLPGAAIINAFPILRFLPSWLPGTGFKRVIAEGRELTSRMRTIPFKYVEDNIKAGSAVPSIIRDRLTTCTTEDDVEVLRDFAPMLYAAGAETTSAALETFFLVMTKNPQIQRKAQDEIDTIVGTDRLPTYDDWTSLPYIEAVVREVLRWRTILPLSLPHTSISDDIYKGYFIPKGTTVLPNVWALTRDEQRYKDPEAFNPDRFIDSNGDLIDDDVDYVFGFGRRTCPGRHMARASVYLTVVRTLAAFNISAVKDESGKDIPISDEYTSGLLCHSLPHACSIVPRSPKAVRLIKEAHAETKDRK